MLDNWNPQIGWATVFAAGGFLSTVGGVAFVWVKGLGLREADHKQLNSRFDALEARVAKAEANFMLASAIEKQFTAIEVDLAAMTKRIEQHEAAVSAGTLITREQMTDGFAGIAEKMAAFTDKFATKAELAANETRTTQGMDRIFKTLDRIESKVDNALNTRTH